MAFPSALDPVRSFKAVWRAVSASPGAIAGWWAIGLGGGIVLYLGFYLVFFILLAAGGAVTEGGQIDDVSEGAQFALGGALLALGLAFAFMMFLLQSWWRVGLENVLADTLRTGRSELADAWKPRGRVLSLIGAQLLVGLVVLVCYLPLLPGTVLVGLASEQSEVLAGLLGGGLGLLWFAFLVYVMLGFSFAPFSAALDPVGPVEALARSWRAARGRRLAMLVFWIAAVVFALAGFLLLCIGYLATASLVLLMPAEAWLALTRGEERAGWWISTGHASGDGGVP